MHIESLMVGIVIGVVGALLLTRMFSLSVTSNSPSKSKNDDGVSTADSVKSAPTNKPYYRIKKMDNLNHIYQLPKVDNGSLGIRLVNNQGLDTTIHKSPEDIALNIEYMEMAGSLLVSFVNGRSAVMSGDLTVVKGPISKTLERMADGKARPMDEDQINWVKKMADGYRSLEAKRIDEVLRTAIE